MSPFTPWMPWMPWGPCGPVAPVGPSTVLGTNFVPLKISPCPEVGLVVVRSTGTPWICVTMDCVCVPVTSPLKLPTSSHAERDWKAGMRSTSGLMAAPPMTTCSFRSDCASTVAEIAGIPVAPSTTEYMPSDTGTVCVPEFQSSSPVASLMANTKLRAPLAATPASSSRPW